MGKLLGSDHKHHQKVMHKTVKKTVKVTYISNPILLRACHASEFRSLVQQLTGKNSNDFIHQSIPPSSEKQSTHNCSYIGWRCKRHILQQINGFCRVRCSRLLLERSCSLLSTDICNYMNNLSVGGGWKFVRVNYHYQVHLVYIHFLSTNVPCVESYSV